MKKPNSSLERLLSAFYNVDDCGVFLEQAGKILGLRLYLPSGDELPEIAAPSAPEAAYRAELSGSGRSCVDVLDDGLYACSIVADAALCAETADALSLAAKFVHSGIELYGWFGEVRAAHPDLFFEQNPEIGTGICCLYFPLDMSKSEGAKVCEKLSKMANALHCYRERGGFALVVRGQEDQRRVLFNELEGMLSRGGLVCGVSGPFASSGIAKGGMEKAREAALFSEYHGSSPLRFVSELRWSLFCSNAERSVRKEGFEIADFIQHRLKRVLAYDKQNGSQYYESMLKYLVFGKSLKLASKELGIHRNTLAYRIGRIGELFGIDFDDRQTCFELLFSCKLIEETGCYL